MNIQKIVKALRQFRWLHKTVGISLALFMLLMACTGLMLGWKKDVEILQPKTHEGISQDLKGWLSFDAISTIAINAVDSATATSNDIDRLDVRPDKGIIKILFRKGYWEVQVDGKTGKVFSVAQRHADWIEHIHDGSIINDFFKLIYTNIIGLGLLTLTISGLWIWYGPKVVRRMK